MMRNYEKMLKPDGMLITHRRGLGWSVETNNTAWGLDDDIWYAVGSAFGFTSRPAVGRVITLQKPLKDRSDERVTVVITSCGRHDLLSRTLASFQKFNTYDIFETIIVEDGQMNQYLEGLNSDSTSVICTGARVGQIAAIDYAYSRVKTPYIFHIEDDWEFFRPNFIEKSLDVLRVQPNCLQVWIRAIGDTNGHPISMGLRRDGNAEWRIMAHKALGGLFDGFSFNPGLRRMKDYKAINGYGVHTIGVYGWSDTFGNREAIISRVYRSRRMFAAILVNDGGSGYVRHIGGQRHIDDRPLDALGGL